MEYRSLEINVISAKDLRKVILISKTRAYAVVSISGDPRASQQQRTAADRAGNGSPTWNFPVTFVVNESVARSNRPAVTFRIRCKRSLGDKDIGVVHVPLSELVGSPGDGKPQFVTYQIRKRSGKPKGELNFSYKWGGCGGGDGWDGGSFGGGGKDGGSGGGGGGCCGGGCGDGGGCGGCGG